MKIPAYFKTGTKKQHAAALLIGIADKMKSVRLVQIFRPVKETNRTHSKGYVEDLSTKRGRKRCAKMAVLPIIMADEFQNAFNS